MLFKNPNKIPANKIKQRFTQSCIIFSDELPAIK